MSPLTDIRSRQDIDRLVAEFYRVAMVDPEIGFFFSEVVQLDLDHHLPKICDFWESILMHTAVYQGNPMLAHIRLSEKHQMTQAHFDRWLMLWQETIDRFYNGPMANQAILKAKQIAALMLHKIDNQDDHKSLI